jgi:hypothetical protein
VIFATFNKIIICTSKTNCADGRRYIDYILGVIKSKPLFATLDIVPVQFWEHLVWMDQANYGGVEEVKEGEEQVQTSQKSEADERRDRKRLHASGEQKKMESLPATLVDEEEEATLFFRDEDDDDDDDDDEQVRPAKKTRTHRKTVNDDDDDDDDGDDDDDDDVQEPGDDGNEGADADGDVVPSSGRHSLKFAMPGNAASSTTQGTYAMQLSVVMQWNIEEYLPGFVLRRGVAGRVFISSVYVSTERFCRGNFETVVADWIYRNCAERLRRRADKEAGAVTPVKQRHSDDVDRDAHAAAILKHQLSESIFKAVDAIAKVPFFLFFFCSVCLNQRANRACRATRRRR